MCVAGAGEFKNAIKNFLGKSVLAVHVKTKPCRFPLRFFNRVFLPFLLLSLHGGEELKNTTKYVNISKNKNNKPES
jgi:hypothetical protein